MMKKAFIGLLILTLCALVQSVYGATSVSGRPCPGGAAALTCNGSSGGGVQQAPDDMDDNSSSQAFGRNTSTDWIATKFVYGGTTGTLCSIETAQVVAGTPTGNLNICIYSDNAGEVGSSLSGGCGTIDSGTFTASLAWYSATVDATITNGTAYWIVANDPSVNTDNYQLWGTDNTCTTENTRNSADGTTWGSVSTATCLMIRLYIKE
jgi:hypothetical protein